MRFGSSGNTLDYTNAKPRIIDGLQSPSPGELVVHVADAIAADNESPPDWPAVACLLMVLMDGDNNLIHGITTSEESSSEVSATADATKK